MAEPFILINCKAFPQGLGSRGQLIAEAAETVGEESGVRIGMAPVYTEIHPISHHFQIPVFAQHIDGVPPGPFTGHVTASAVRHAGAVGTLVNHSERRLTLAEIEACVRAAREAKLETVVCTNNDPTTAAAAALGPDYVAVEPPELIGSGISVCKADPGIIGRSVEAIYEKH